MERDPLQGKEVPGGPKKAPGFPHRPFCRRGPPKSHREGGALTRRCTFGPMEPPFPGRHGQGIQELSFLLLQIGDRREFIQGLTSGMAGFLQVPALPVHYLEEDRPAAARCPSYPAHL